MSQSTHYPAGTVRALLQTDHVSERTREALTERLTRQPGPLQFFTADEAETFQQVADRLVPQTDQAGYVVDLVGLADERLASQEGDGWRYDALPPDGVAFRQGLHGVQESAQVRFGQPFGKLTPTQQDDLLTQVQQGNAPGDTWQQLPSARFFEELLVELVTDYYSYPLVQEAIGYVGMADQPAWNRVGMNELEDREPRQQPTK